MEILSKTRFAHESNAVSNAVAEFLLDNFSLVEDYNMQVIEAREYTKNKLLEKGIKSHGNKGNYLFLDLMKISLLIKYVKNWI